MSQRNGESRPADTEGDPVGKGSADEPRDMPSAERAGASAVLVALVAQAPTQSGPILGNPAGNPALTGSMPGTAARLTAETALSTELIREAKVNFAVIGGTAFDRWLVRELRTIGAALAHPVPQNLLDIIEGHRKVTR